MSLGGNSGVLLMLAWLAGPTLLPAQNRIMTVEGHANGDACGVVVRSVGDVDKDGRGDYAVGAPGDDGNGKDSGSVLVYSGEDDSVIRVFRGGAARDRFGYSLAGAGDVNDDGYDDLIVGAPYEDNGDGEHLHENAGSAQVFSGRDGKLLYTFRGPSRGDALGWSVGGLGDVNRDGYADVVAGAPFYDREETPDVGLVRVFSGKNGKMLYQIDGQERGDRFGWSVCSAADHNSDRAQELLVGVEGSSQRQKQAGAAQLFSGKSGQLLRTFRTGQEQDYFGTAVANAGDIDKDGRDDLLIGAWNGSNTDGDRTGIARVVSGRTGKTLLQVEGTTVHDRFGAAVVAPGDVDQDGFPDLAIGAPQEADKGSGYVRVFSGKTGAILFTLIGEAIGDGFGTSLCAMGDRNEDGIPDLMVGAPGLRGRGGWHVFAGPSR